MVDIVFILQERSGNYSCLPADSTVFQIRIHCLHAEVVIAVLPAGICRLDLQLVGSVDKLGQAFLKGNLIYTNINNVYIFKVRQNLKPIYSVIIILLQAQNKVTESQQFVLN